MLGAVGVGAANAYTIDQVDIEYWADLGTENEAVLVLDSGPDQLAFGYRWDGDATSWDMLQALDSAGNLAVSATDYGDLGLFINGFTYDTFSLFGDWPNSILGSWNSEDGEAWTAPNVGVELRMLSDGAFDGWSLDLDTENFTLENPPRTPVIPEPASLALLAVGTVALLRRGAR